MVLIVRTPNIEIDGLFTTPLILDPQAKPERRRVTRVRNRRQDATQSYDPKPTEHVDLGELVDEIDFDF